MENLTVKVYPSHDEQVVMKKLIGITGSGIIGSDPWDGKCWSGSATPFFKECKKTGLLEDAIGVEASQLKRYFLMIANFNPNKNIWRTKFHLDVNYYKALTKELKHKLSKYDQSFNFLQLGAIYNVVEACNGNSECYSFNDGNLACMTRSPFFDKTLLPYTKNALNWEKKVNQSLTKIFTFGNYLRTSFINDYNIPESKVVSIGAGMNFTVPDASVLDKDYSKQNIIFIGVDFYRKGGVALIKSFNELTKKYPHAKLHVIGPKVLPEEIKNSNNSSIVYHGYLNRNDSRFGKIMREGTVGVLPSRYEPFGISLIECMSYGMPGIATNDWAFPEMVTPGANGFLINKDDSVSLTEALDHYLNDPSLAALHGQNARQLALNNYGWDKVVSRLKSELIK